ncbi:MAG: FtsQ-type POTRA domain-containing protein, partial [Deltaproteobacteria bacterium]|nr:FtsQ-type POTRA domain-containing protein [Deltaproteobacteria bacterium]
MNREPSMQVPFKVEKGATARAALANDRRARWAAIGKAVLRMVGAMALSALLALGAVAGWNQLMHSSFFDAKTVRFRGVANARKDDLLARSGLKAGQNLFQADLAAAARGVESSPWVISARISRSFPPAFDVEVVEHVPAVRAQLGRIYLVDIQGRVFKRLDDDDQAALQQLPLVTGIARGDWEA